MSGRASPQDRLTSVEAAASVSDRALNQCFALLAGLEDERQRKRARYSTERLSDDEDDDGESDSPWFDKYLELQGPEGIQKLCNFAPQEFELLWDDLKDFITSNWNVGQGRKSDCSARDCLFQTLVALKHCGTWDIVAAVFQQKHASTFERRILGMLNVLQPYIYEIFVDKVADKKNMHTLMVDGKRFEHFPYARYATDVTFHHTNIPSGGSLERKTMYSEEHHMYGHKVEVSVLPNGLAIGCTTAEKGGVADAEIFKKNHAFHLKHLAKLPADEGVEDEGRFKDQFPGKWAVLVDKGYQGIQGDPGVRAIIPTKKPVTGNSLSTTSKTTA